MRAVALIERYAVPALARPALPPQTVKVAYPTLPLQHYLTYTDILARVSSKARFTLERPQSMENLDMNDASGQSYGFITYRKVLSGLQPGARLQVPPVKDFGILLIDGQIVQPLTDGAKGPSDYWMNEGLEVALDSVDGEGSYLVEVLVENMGRINIGDLFQLKGIPQGDISLDGVALTDFQVIALEFKAEWVRGLANWRLVDDPAHAPPIRAPVLFQSEFEVVGSPADTFLDMRSWHKGVVFVNGFNVGRYFRVGPQQTLYVPAPLLRPGTNTVTVFEQLRPGTHIHFSSVPILDDTPTAPASPQ